LCPVGSEDKEQLMVSGDRLTREEGLAAFDEHLRRVRGLCAGARSNYARFAGAFLQRACPGGPVEVARIHAHDVDGFIGSLAGCYQPRTVELAASSLRSFFRFLRAAGHPSPARTAARRRRDQTRPA
jgi:site-specific recombinase XerD